MHAKPNSTSLRGMSEEEVRRQALIAFGGIEKTREQCHKEKNSAPLETLLWDERFAFRGLLSKLADRPRFEAALLALFATIGVLLAALGMYGVVAFLVTQRTSGIGVRMAMGATRVDILQLMGMQGLRMIATGTLVGLLIAAVSSRVLGSLLFGVRPDDPLSLASVCLLLGLVASVATCVPAYRAMRVDPSQALRHE